jgi:flagella synthesis protein FlgN
MSQPKSLHDLSPHELINQQLIQLHAMEKMLAEERLVLEQHNPNNLTQLIKKKNELLVAIQGLDNFIGLNTPFAQGRSQGLFEEEVTEIAKSLARCQQQNVINGNIIQQSQLAVERMKSSLLDSHNKSAVTYDGSGKKHAGLSSLNLKA